MTTKKQVKKEVLESSIVQFTFSADAVVYCVGVCLTAGGTRKANIESLL